MTAYPMFGLVKEVFERRYREEFGLDGCEFVYVGEADRFIRIPVSWPEPSFAEEPEVPPSAIGTFRYVEVRPDRWIEVMADNITYRFYWADDGARVFVTWRRV